MIHLQIDTGLYALSVMEYALQRIAHREPHTLVLCTGQWGRREAKWWAVPDSLTLSFNVSDGPRGASYTTLPPPPLANLLPVLRPRARYALFPAMFLSNLTEKISTLDVRSVQTSMPVNMVIDEESLNAPQNKIRKAVYFWVHHLGINMEGLCANSYTCPTSPVHFPVLDFCLPPLSIILSPPTGNFDLIEFIFKVFIT
ncbi:hypothetical protein BKA93DRAFT_753881 [Sparassis latifolia]